MKPVRKKSSQAPVREREDSESPLLDKIEGDLERDGISLFENDNVDPDYLELPRDITEVPSSELGKYLNAFTQQKMWTRTLIGRVSVMVKETSRKLDQERDRIYAASPVKMSVKEKELRVATDPVCKQLLAKMDYYESKLAILEDYLENIVDAIFNISREISRRSADISDESRDHNVGRRRFGR